MARHSGFGIGLSAVLASVVIWGAQLPVAKSAYGVMDPVSLTALRYALAVSVLLGLLAWREGRAAFSLGGRPWLMLAAGLCGMAGSPLLVFAGLAFTTPEHAVIILALQPSMSALAQWALRGTRPAAFTAGSIVVAFAGVVLVVTGHGPGSSGKFIGDVLVLAGAACWVSYSLMLALFPGMSALRFTAISCAIGTTMILITALAGIVLGMARLPSAPEALSVTPHILYLAFAGVTAAMVMWNFGSPRVGTLNSILLLNLMPVETYLIRYLQGAHFATQEWLGAGLVIGALVANNLYQRRMLAREGAREAAAGDADEGKSARA
jgi:drug/metabolite transporter (DMT)-like permease